MVQGANIVVQDSLLTENEGAQAIYGFHSVIELTNATYSDNYGLDGSLSPAVELVSSQATISQSHFSSSRGALSSLHNGGYIRDVSNNELTVRGSTFENGNALNGGAIYSGMESSVSILDSSFRNCSSAKRGGAIYSTFLTGLRMSNSSF